MSARQTAAVILAAGASTRLGRPKQLLVVDGETLLDRAIRTALEAGCSPVLAVLGAALPQVVTHTKRHDYIKLIHRNWQQGMASSIVRGIENLPSIAPSATGVILMTCDQPAVTPEHLRALAASGETTASFYAGRPGVPAYFPAAAFPQLLQLTGDSGARTLLQHAPTIALPGGELDIDTEADHQAAKQAI
jgi:molybdenum cofactor cytidylyltransferase